MEKIIYIAELDADVDDVVAAEYLYNKNLLECVVLDPFPKTDIGKERLKELTNLGITVSKKIPNIAKYVFVGGALTEVARYILNRKIEYLIMNGGFVGNNIVNKEDELDKFKGKTTIRTFNFNCDVAAADKVLKSKESQIKEIILIGKNVCHNELNTEKYIWNNKESLKLFKKYNVKPGKRQHDMLACHEGLSILNLIKEPTFCEFLDVYPFNNGLKGNMTEWGSTLNQEKTPYRKVKSAIKFKKN